MFVGRGGGAGVKKVDWNRAERFGRLLRYRIIVRICASPYRTRSQCVVNDFRYSVILNCMANSFDEVPSFKVWSRAIIKIVFTRYSSPPLYV